MAEGVIDTANLIVLPSGKSFDRKRFAEYTDDEIKATVAECFNVAHVIRTLKINKVYHYKIKEFIENNKLSTAHFKIVYKHTPYNGKQIRSFSSFKKTLLNQGKLINKCAICKMEPIWNNKPLMLQLDHINGDHSNNNIENLRLLCPNCHTQTDTYTGRNSKKDTEKTGKLVIETIIEKKPKKIYTLKEPCVNEVINNNTDIKLTKCLNCSKDIRCDSKSDICRLCYNKSIRIVERPRYKCLIDEINKDGVLATARKYNVSNTTILKWVKFYEINGDNNENIIITNEGPTQPLKCTSCDAKITKQSKTGMCETCQKKSIRIVERPPYEILLKEVNELGYVQVGKKYRVSDNSIRKWLKNYTKLSTK